MQEALQNIHKHASATKVEINVISKDKIIIFIKDNGKGFKRRIEIWIWSSKHERKSIRSRFQIQYIFG
jgi:signal transduction histidine kinase